MAALIQNIGKISNTPLPPVFPIAWLMCLSTQHTESSEDESLHLTFLT